MHVRMHIRLLVLASLAWLVFWIVGLPDYYQQYSDRFMAWFVILLLPALELVIFLVLRRISSTRRIAFSLWLSFYFTAPLVVYDWLYCGLYRGHGLGFFTDFWYLTLYYIIPWLLLPATAMLLNKSSAGVQVKERSS